jgi:putative redox protein
VKISVDWQDGMLLQATGESNVPVAIDSSPEFGGRNLGARPMELILMGMAGCTALDVLSILGKMHVQLTSFTVEVEAERAAVDPKVFTSSVLTYRFQMAEVKEDKVLRAITLSLEKYCSAVNTLKIAMPVQWRLEINGVAGELKPV